MYCNLEQQKDCPPGEEPASGFGIERCAMQGSFATSSLLELFAKATEFLDSFQCFGLPQSLNDTGCTDIFAEIIINNPNEENDCGGYERGDPSGDIVVPDNDVCAFVAELNLPKIPCPCGYSVAVEIVNPNTTEGTGDIGDATYSPGTESGVYELSLIHI